MLRQAYQSRLFLSRGEVAWEPSEGTTLKIYSRNQLKGLSQVFTERFPRILAVLAEINERLGNIEERVRNA